MKRKAFGAWLGIAALLSACGGGGSGGSSAPPTSGPPSNAPPATGACSLRARQDWAAAQMREWYLFPETLPTNLDPTGYTTLEAYVDALTATARSQRRDRFFTYVTSIAEENAYYSSGANAGFGVRLAYDIAQRRVFVAEAYEGAPALTAGIDRGAEILAIGTSAGNLRPVSDILAAQGAEGVTEALGPTTVGTSRVLRIADAAGTREVTVTKAQYTLTPVSNRYGARIISDGGRQVGYVNLRTFIDPADPALRSAFAQFRAAGITEVIVDLRYNGGGLVSIAGLMGDLLGGNRSSADVFSFTVYRPEKAASNSTRRFTARSEAISPTRIAFIGTGGSASASELVINSFIPYFGNRAALIGTNTYGKPVGQIAVDRSECDDRLRIIAFATQNSNRQGDYYDGLAATIGASCQAADDLSRPMGDPAEASTRQALDFLAGRSCTAIPATPVSAQGLQPPARRELLMPARPTTPQRDAPGTF